MVLWRLGMGKKECGEIPASRPPVDSWCMRGRQRGDHVYTQVRWLEKTRSNHKDGSSKMAARITQRGHSAIRNLSLARGLTGNATVARPRQLSAALSEVHSTTSELLRSPLSTTRTVTRNDGAGQSDKNFTAVATGGYEYPGIPQFTDLYAKRQW